MSLIPQQFDKRTYWGRKYDWDFSPLDEFSLSPAETGITLVSATISAGDDGALTLGTPVVSGLKVQMLVSGGTAGVAYTITVKVTTIPNNYPLDWDGVINVLP